jgi:hypothetical protein
MHETAVDRHVCDNIECHVAYLGIPRYHVIAYPEENVVAMFDPRTRLFHNISSKSTLLLYNSDTIDIALYHTLTKMEIDIESIIRMVCDG